MPIVLLVGGVACTVASSACASRPCEEGGKAGGEGSVPSAAIGESLSAFRRDGACLAASRACYKSIHRVKSSKVKYIQSRTAKYKYRSNYSQVEFSQAKGAPAARACAIAEPRREGCNHRRWRRMEEWHLWVRAQPRRCRSASSPPPARVHARVRYARAVVCYAGVGAMRSVVWHAQWCGMPRVVRYVQWCAMCSGMLCVVVHYA